jgi:hypothetical protein
MKQDVYVVCSAKKKSDHCLTQCQCGKPHLRETGHDACHLNWETCTLSKSGIIQVICKPIKRKKI